MKYLKIEVLELPDAKVAQFATAEALAVSSDFEHSEMREEILQGICSENPDVKAQIQKFREENQ